MSLETKHSQLLNLIQYRHVAFVILFFAALYCHTFLRPSDFNIHVSSNSWLRWQTLLLLLICVPGRLLGLFSVGCALMPQNKHTWQVPEKEGKKRAFERLMLCYVTRGQNVEALCRTLSSLPAPKSIDSRLSIHVVTEAPALPALTALNLLDITFNGVPTDFRPPRALYKARALEYFRLAQNLNSTTWTLHLDEETTLSTYAIQTAIRLIENGDCHIAQGIILYNAHKYWANWLTASADVVRVLDDFGRYAWQWTRPRQPVFGMHGSFVLCNGKVEQDVGWDTDCLTEDWWFAVQAARRGFKFAFLPSFAREQSPQSLLDLFKQRRRWAAGIWTVGDWKATVMVALWSWQTLEIFMWLLPKILGYTVNLPIGLWHASCVQNSVMLAAMVLALAFQEFDANVSFADFCVHALYLIATLPFVGMLDSLAAASTVVWGVGASFYVVSK